MKSADWQQIETILDEVLQLPKNERDIYIEKKCGNDPQLKGEVTELLESISASEGWLENPGDFKRDFLSDISNDIDLLSSERSLIGKQVGSYTIEKKIGEGGMGSVYLAERTAGEFEHQVAIKIIRHGFANRENIERFKREQRILAGMNHPGIARLFDGGITSDGFPYIIMEYVNGSPITDYCDENRCSVDDKIDLFIQVLEAVRHAHENLVIHRDLKPANIFITETGKVKILDFGISKLLEEEEAEMITQTGSRILTLKYAAPEQIKQTSITTATDLYALGMVFYELFSNIGPFDLDEKSKYEIEHCVINNNPPKPSHRTESKRLRKTLSGDLDAIALKSIRKEPGQRYRVANEFLEDLKNYQKKLPVSARDDSFQYKSQKFLKRHRQGILITAVFLLLIIGFAGFYTWNITQERNLARQEAERAEREQQRAEEVTEFMVNLFQSNNPEESLGEEVSVQEVLEQSIDRIENADISLINKATILGTIAQINIKLGDYDNAQMLLDRAMPIVTDSLELQNVNTASIPVIKGNLATTLGDFQTAGISFQLADSIFRTYSLTEHTEFLDLKFNMVELHNVNIEYKKSLDVLNEMNPNKFGTDEYSKELKTDYYNYKAIALKNLGEYEKAIDNYLMAIELREEFYGHDNPETATAMNNLANVYVEKEQLGKALNLSKKAHEIRNYVFGPNHYLTGSTLNTLSMISEEMGKYDEALDYAKRSVHANKISLGESHIRYALTLRNTSDVLRLMGKYNEAKEYLDRSSSIIHENYSENNTYKGYVNLGYAKLFHALEDFESANKYYSTTIHQFKNGRGENHPSVGEVLVSFGKMEILRKNYIQAQNHFSEARDNFLQNFDSTNSKIINVDSLMAAISKDVAAQ